MPKVAPKKPDPIEIDVPPLGPRLVHLRKLRGYSQYSLADEMGVSRKKISDYERGLAHPNDEMIIRLSLTLKVSADTLLGLKEIELSDNPPSVRFTKRLKELDKLPEAKKRAVIQILDQFIQPEQTGTQTS